MQQMMQIARCEDHDRLLLPITKEPARSSMRECWKAPIRFGFLQIETPAFNCILTHSEEKPKPGLS